MRDREAEKRKYEMNKKKEEKKKEKRRKRRDEQRRQEKRKNSIFPPPPSPYVITDSSSSIPERGWSIHAYRSFQGENCSLCWDWCTASPCLLPARKSLPRSPQWLRSPSRFSLVTMWCRIASQVDQREVLQSTRPLLDPRPSTLHTIHWLPPVDLGEANRQSMLEEDQAENQHRHHWPRRQGRILQSWTVYCPNGASVDRSDPEQKWELPFLQLSTCRKRE